MFQRHVFGKLEMKHTLNIRSKERQYLPNVFATNKGRKYPALRLLSDNTCEGSEHRLLPSLFGVETHLSRSSLVATPDTTNNRKNATTMCTLAAYGRKEFSCVLVHSAGHFLSRAEEHTNSDCYISTTCLVL